MWYIYKKCTIMIKRINHTEEIEAKLKKQGKIRYFDKPIHIKRVKKMNEEMTKIHRAYCSRRTKSNVVYG